MKRIGLLSDTHGFLDDRVINFFKECDEIWHAGDIGTIETADLLANFKPFRAVFGNIDDHKIRSAYPEYQDFICEGTRVLMVHIGGYPDHYFKEVRKKLHDNSYQLFISGHSHILKVMPDKKYNLLHINPGSCGNSGFHKFKTAIRFNLHKGKISDLEVLELPRN
jgi:putative phosphoesterase